MADKLAAFSFMLASGAASYGWLATANGVATLIVTIIAGIGGVAGAAYWCEKWRAERAERLRKK